MSQKIGIFFIVLITFFFLNNSDNCKFNVIIFLLFKKHDVLYCELQTRKLTKSVEEKLTCKQMPVESIHVLAHE